MGERPPWYGGNKIPTAYLQRFMPPRPPEQEGMSDELRSFLNVLGVSDPDPDPVPTSVDVDGLL